MQYINAGCTMVEKKKDQKDTCDDESILCAQIMDIFLDLVNTIEMAYVIA